MNSLEMYIPNGERGDYIGYWYRLTHDECRLIVMKDTYLNVNRITRPVRTNYD